MYRFEKLYVDLVTPDRTVLIAYLTRTHLVGATIPQGAIEIYRPDGRRESIRATVSRRVVDRVLAGNAERLSFQLPEGRLDVGVREWNSRLTSASKLVAPDLSWSVVTARSPIVAEWRQTPVPRTLEGTGYADQVTMNRFLRGLDIEQVDWGRIHLAETTIVFNGIRFKTGQKWENATVYNSELGTESFDRFELIRNGDRFRLRFPIGELTATIDRVLHDGPALDRDRFPSSLERWAVRWTTGPLRETRFLSHIQGELYGRSVRGTMIHEQVHSGGARAPQGKSLKRQTKRTEDAYAEQSV